MKRELLTPVVCNHCRRVYDLCAGEPIARYADCTVYKTPCCGRTVDDRKWVSSPAFTELNHAERQAMRAGRHVVDMQGNRFLAP